MQYIVMLIYCSFEGLCKPQSLYELILFAFCLIINVLYVFCTFLYK